MDENLIDFVEITCIIDDLRRYFANFIPKTTHDLCLLFVPKKKTRYMTEIIKVIMNELPCGLYLFESRNQEMRILQTNWDKFYIDKNMFNHAQILSKN